MVKNYWEKRFKKELVEEEDKLKQEVADAVKTKNLMKLSNVTPNFHKRSDHYDLNLMNDMFTMFYPLIFQKSVKLMMK
jgi:hypothetical protein